MNLMTMRFKGFTWRINPTELRVEHARRVKENVLPFSESKAVDLGARKRQVSGEGYLTGQGCMGEWRRLEALMRAGGPGFLQLPGLEPMWAVMDSLKLLGEAGEGLVRYSFAFTEFYGGEAYLGGGRHFASAGESLWDYAGRYGWNIERLRRANPHIRDIACLEAGEAVYAP